MQLTGKAAFAFSMFIASSLANAADIRTSANPDPAEGRVVSSAGEPQPYITINGNIVIGDYAKFKRASNSVPRYSVVVLTSNGGALEDGLNIGLSIRRMEYSTFVPEYCMSACALMWLAGAYRSAPDFAKIGFHGASYRNGEPSIRGNALIGAYLANLGLSYRAISALINVGQDDINLLTPEWAKELGIRMLRAKPIR